MQRYELLDTFSRALTGPCGVKRGEPVLVCVSGGIDSMVLLDLMHRIAPLLDMSLGVIHVDHGLRGAASEHDACFVDEQCRKLSLPFHLARLGMDPCTANLEEAARKKRYQAVLECMRHNGYVCAATGHTLDDQAETVLYRVIRGTGIRGLAGMTYRRDDGIIRPMLGVTRVLIEGYAAQKGVHFVQDRSNDNTHHARNLIRHSILPVMRRINQRAAEAVASLASIAFQEGAVLEMMASEVTRNTLDFDWCLIRGYRIHELRLVPEAVLRRLLISTITSMTGELRGIGSLQIEKVLQVIHGYVTAHALQRKVRICREGSLLVFHRLQEGPFYMHSIYQGGDFIVPEIGKTIRIMFAGESLKNAVLRSWLPGDRMHGRRIADMLSAMKVPRSLRPFWPVLAANGIVVAVAVAREKISFSGLIMEPGHE